MKILINKDYKVTSDFGNLGYVGETNARTITFEGLDVECADSYKKRLDKLDKVFRYGGIKL